MRIKNDVSKRHVLTLWNRVAGMTREECVDHLVGGQTANSEEFLRVPLEELRRLVSLTLSTRPVDAVVWTNHFAPRSAA